METWNVREITLIARLPGRPDLQAALPCTRVSWQPASDMPPPHAKPSDAGYVLACGVAMKPLADVEWVPTHVSFHAEGYMESREFQVTGWDADPQSRTVKFAIP